jgi:hypothetical protein
MAPIHTVGYEDRTVEELIDALLCVERSHDICHRSVVAASAVDLDPQLEVVPIP